MADALLEEFLDRFDGEHYPANFRRDYEALECLAHNEQGETLLVKDRKTGSLCVAKCYSEAQPVARAGESSLLQGFHHSGLPSFINEYRDESTLCVVRGFVEGTPLDQLAANAPLEPRRAVGIILQLCDILNYLHSQNPPIIHRDLKPQNVIVDERGHVTLIDFGISRIYDKAARADTLCFGTRHYAAPEQYGFAQTDPRSDIYSLGVLLCWLLTGQEDVEQGKPAIRDRRLLAVVEKCTAFDPRGRFRNALQVRDALSGRTQRRRALVGLAAALLLAGALLTARLTAGVHFKEPLIAQAARAALDKDSGPLSEEDLASVQELFVFADNATTDQESFERLVDEFARGGGSQTRGGITTLDDLAKMKNLRKVKLAFQDIHDLAPLAGLPGLQELDLRNNPVESVAPLAGMSSLNTLILFDSNVSDLTALSACPNLMLLDVGGTPITSPAAFQGLSALRTLILHKSQLQTLQGIQAFPQLEMIHLANTPVHDLSPLLALPNLQRVIVSEDMRAAVEALGGKAKFEVEYQ
jgi:hypothetical protein